MKWYLIFFAALLLFASTQRKEAKIFQLEKRLTKIEEASTYYMKYDASKTQLELETASDLETGYVYQASNADRVYFSKINGSAEMTSTISNVIGSTVAVKYENSGFSGTVLTTGLGFTTGQEDEIMIYIDGAIIATALYSITAPGVVTFADNYDNAALILIY